jgi:ribosomal protein S12 methylthiotransferase
VFTYSPEEGTPSPAYAGPVPAELAAERAGLLQERQDAIAWERHRKLIGSVQDVLVDGPSEDPAFAWEGRTAGQAPEIDGVVYLRHDTARGVGGPQLRGPHVQGRFARVRIVEVEGYELVGERI